MKTYSLFYPALQKQVLNACGINMANERNCRDISIKIFNRDRNYLSESTIKRFFGILPCKDDPSPFVLESLAKFTGYQSWDEFKLRSRSRAEVPDAHSHTDYINPSNTPGTAAPNCHEAFQQKGPQHIQLKIPPYKNQ